jgi:membrane-associated protease RseP (regulator of RpoE activity)
MILSGGIEMDAQSVTPESVWLGNLLAGFFEISDITYGVQGGQAIRIRGRFLVPTEEAFKVLAPRCRTAGRTLTFRREKQDDLIIILNGVVQPKSNNNWLPVLLAILTVPSVVISYLLVWENPALTWEAITASLPHALLFAGSLLAILLTHELGHFFMARRLGVAVSLPFLIPFPLSPFGTMGAVIRLKDIPPSKKALLLIGAAGPLAGLCITLPVLFIGLSLSKVASTPASGYVLEGNSLLYMVTKYIVFGRWLPSGNTDVFIHPMAFAGWAGLLVTAMNLIPAGQLDGGHIAYALLGKSARYVMWGMLAILLVLGIWWQGWWLWAVLIFVVNRNHPSPLDDLSALSPRERIIAIAMLLIFILSFTPLPMTVVM